MEGYVFALMANSGTDPDLEEEDARLEQEQREKELRDKELEVRYLIKLEEDGERDATGSPLGKQLERADADLVSKPAVQDHYAVLWPPGGVFSGSAGCYSSSASWTGREPLSLLESLDESAASSTDMVGGVTAAADELKLPKLSNQIELVRPAPFEAHSAAGCYTPLPPLRMALPSFPRNNFPRAPYEKATSRRAVLLLQEQKTIIRTKCCKPPRHAMKGLFYQSYEVLKRHYDSLSHVCRQ